MVDVVVSYSQAELRKYSGNQQQPTKLHCKKNCHIYQTLFLNWKIPSSDGLKGKKYRLQYDIETD